MGLTNNRQLTNSLKFSWQLTFALGFTDNCKSQFPFHDLDDNAFKIVLYEFQHGTISYDADHLETLFFNPILDQHSTLSDPNSDLDPDLNNQDYASSFDLSSNNIFWRYKFWLA